MGMKAGISLASQTCRFTPIDYTMETQPVVGPGISFLMEAFRHEHLSLQTDLAVSVKGSKTTTQSVTVNHLDNDRIVVNKGEFNASRFSYLSFCPLARYRVDKERLTSYAMMGPRLDLLLKYKTGSDYPLDEQNKVIVGLSGGAGVEFSFNQLGVFIEAQYQPDISAVTNHEPLRINNSTLLFTLGIRYLNVQ
jgi:hypothetical protein